MHFRLENLKMLLLCIGMHRNENSWPKPNKMKHWAEGQIPNTVFHIFSPMKAYFAIFSPLHKLKSQNVLFTVLSCFSNKKIYKPDSKKSWDTVQIVNKKECNNLQIS